MLSVCLAGVLVKEARSKNLSAKIPAPIGAWPLQRRRRRPYKLFEFPAVYQPLPVSIVRGRRDVTVAIRVGISRRRQLWLAEHGCCRLRPSATDEDRYHRGRPSASQ